MKAKIFLCLIVCFSSPGFSVQQQLQRAQNLMEAGDSLEAIQVVHGLLQQERPRWQRDLLFYNLGTLFFTENLPQDALLAFESIPQPTIPVPRFSRQLFLNESIAHLLLAQELLQKSAPVDRMIPLEKSQWHLMEAAALLANVQNSQGPASPTHLLQQMIHAKERKVLAQFRTEFLLDLSRSEGLAWLLYNLRNFSKQPNSLPLLQQQLSSLDPLWIVLNVNNGGADRDFRMAEMSFYSALVLAEEKRAEEVQKELMQTMALLEELLKDDPSQSKRDLLWILLREGASQSPIQEKTWQAIEEVLSDFPPAIRRPWEPAIRLLEMSREASKEGHPDAPFLYGGAIIQFVNRLESPRDEITYNVLKNLVTKQQIAYRLGQKMQTEDQRTFVELLERQILRQALAFPKTVYEEQKTLFDNEESPCLDFPWSRVFPFFISGYETLEKGLSSPDLDKKEWVRMQERVWEQWHNAYLTLLMPPEQSFAAAPESEREEWFQLWHPLQMMEAQDQTPIPIIPGAEQGERPW